MKRREVEGGLRFITFSCQRRLPMFRSDSAAGLFADRLAWARGRYDFKLFAWVIMPEHVHLITRPAPGRIMTEALHALRPQSPCAPLRAGGTSWPASAMIDHTTRAPSPGVLASGSAAAGLTAISVMLASLNEVRYIHRNPVERKLVERPEQWRWSSARWWMGLRTGELECDDPPDVGIDWSAWKGFV
jgi:putative transposase